VGPEEGQNGYPCRKTRGPEILPRRIKCYVCPCQRQGHTKEEMEKHR